MVIETLLKRDRVLVAIALASATALAWGYVLNGAGLEMPALQMSGLPSAAGVMPFMEAAEWTAGYTALLLVMWWLMMAGMMLPSATPMMLLFAALSRRRVAGANGTVSIGAFCAGYLSIWGGFSVAAVAMQWALDCLSLLSPEMVTSSQVLGAALLIAAGIWQFTPWKDACLKQCRSPITFLAQRWHCGAIGAWRMGAAHGLYCLGCCWALMLLLFYGGVMNVYWIAGLASFVLIEKVIASGRQIGIVTGIGLIAWGSIMLVSLMN